MIMCSFRNVNWRRPRIPSVAEARLNIGAGKSAFSTSGIGRSASLCRHRCRSWRTMKAQVSEFAIKLHSHLRMSLPRSHTSKTYKMKTDKRMNTNGIGINSFSINCCKFSSYRTLRIISMVRLK